VSEAVMLPMVIPVSKVTMRSDVMELPKVAVLSVPSAYAVSPTQFVVVVQLPGAFSFQVALVLWAEARLIAKKDTQAI